MSKKLIAIASAAALALAALVGVAPASANTFVVEVQKTAGSSPAQTGASPVVTPTGISAAAAYNVNVPSSNVIRSTNNASGAPTTAVEFHVTTTTARGQVDVTATGGVLLITGTQLASSLTTVATGTTSLTDFSSGSKYLFYAFNTSTTAGTVVISNAGNSKTVYLAGISNFAYKLQLTGPASVGPGGNIDVTGTIVDAFGNNLTTALAADKFDFARVGAAAAPGYLYTAATNTYRFRTVAPTTAVPVALQVALNGDNTATKVTAFGDPVNSQFFTVQVADLAVANAALTAQVAALQATMADMRTKARSVTKKKYNTLARKWNAQNRTARVALKK